MDFCNQTRSAISPDYKPTECVRADVAYCYERPGDDPDPSAVGVNASNDDEIVEPGFVHHKTAEIAEPKPV